MASGTPRSWRAGAKTRKAWHNLRQVGLGLLVEQGTRLPLYYRVYPGNLHDSRLFAQVMDEMLGAVTGLGGTKERLTVVIDKGMNLRGQLRLDRRAPAPALYHHLLHLLRPGAGWDPRWSVFGAHRHRKKPAPNPGGSA